MRKHFEVDGVRVTCTQHALSRYMLRIKHIADPTQQELNKGTKDIERLLTLDLQVSSSPPEWITDTLTEEAAVRRAEHYVIVGRDICFPASVKTHSQYPSVVTDIFLLTLLTRGEMSPEARKRHNTARSDHKRMLRDYRGLKAWLGENNRWN